MGHRMRRSNRSTRCCSRPGECLVRGKHKRYYAEGRDKRRIHSIRHGTQLSLVTEQPLQRTLSRAFRPRKCTINN